MRGKLFEDNYIYTYFFQNSSIFFCDVYPLQLGASGDPERILEELYGDFPLVRSTEDAGSSNP